MSNPLVAVLCTGAICSAIVGYLNAMEVLFMLAFAVALWQNFVGWTLLDRISKKRNQ